MFMDFFLGGKMEFFRQRGLTPNLKKNLKKFLKIFFFKKNCFKQINSAKTSIFVFSSLGASKRPPYWLYSVDFTIFGSHRENYSTPSWWDPKFWKLAEHSRYGGYFEALSVLRMKNWKFSNFREFLAEKKFFFVKIFQNKKSIFWAQNLSSF